MSYKLSAVPASWSALRNETRKPYFRELRDFVNEDSESHEIYPPARDVFNALELTPLRNVRVLLLGQDPYPGAGQAHGVAFRVRPGLKIPASRRNIVKELASDVGFVPPSHGSLVTWAERGVLL